MLFAESPASPQSQPAESWQTAQVPQQKKTPLRPVDWFRRADSLTNLRLPGSAPFHLKVAFHAYPGIDYAVHRQSPILNGDGVYEETWLSPETWRREVTLGEYHAVEIRSGGRRTFHASSDYEPSRVMMLLGALLAPIPRSILEPEINEEQIHLKTEHLTAGAIPWVRISFRYEGKHGVPEVLAYDFLSSGILVRREDQYSGLLTSWDDDQLFAGKIVPRHFSVQGGGLSGPMVTASLTIESPPLSDLAIAQIPGEPADPGSTLRPIESQDMDNSGASPIHFEAPPLPSDRYPSGVETIVIAVVDREGRPREPELGAIRNYGQSVTQHDIDVVAATAQQMVTSILKDRYHPALIDGKPCQTYWSLTMFSHPD